MASNVSDQEGLVNGECLYCAKAGLLDSRGACKQCIYDAFRREEVEAEIFAGEWDPPHEEEENDGE